MTVLGEMKKKWNDELDDGAAAEDRRRRMDGLIVCLMRHRSEESSVSKRHDWDESGGEAAIGRW